MTLFFSQVIFSASHVPPTQSPRPSVKGLLLLCVPSAMCPLYQPPKISTSKPAPLNPDRCVSSRPVSYPLMDLRLFRVPSFPSPECRPAAAGTPPLQHAASPFPALSHCQSVRISPCRPVVLQQPPLGNATALSGQQLALHMAVRGTFLVMRGHTPLPFLPIASVTLLSKFIVLVTDTFSGCA